MANETSYTDRQLTLIELRDNLTRIIENNIASGWEDRNNLPVHFRTIRGKNDNFTPVARACGSWFTYHDENERPIDCVILEGYDSKTTKTGKRKAKITAKPTTRPCLNCSAEMTPQTSYQECCSDECDKVYFGK